jgi:hypothetical protein
VQESGDFDNGAVGAFGIRQVFRHIPDPVHMPPIMAGTVVGKMTFRKMRDFLN